MGSYLSSNAESNAAKNKVRKTGGEPPKDWGKNGIKIYIMRVKIMLGYHWACTLYCRRTKKVIVVNRDQGLDISCNKTLKEAHHITKTYLGGVNYEEKRFL